jgi:hypothetical protein
MSRTSSSSPGKFHKTALLSSVSETCAADPILAPSFNWRAHLAVHPAAELFPLMSEIELKELAENIEANGLIDPIVLWTKDDKLLLDGRNRLNAMAQAGLLGIDKDGNLLDLQSDNRIKLQFYTDGDPYALAVALNIRRRHLSVEQRRELIAKVLKATPEKSNRQIAKIVDASHPHVARARRALEEAGDVETVTTSVDTKGRKQPAKRPRSATKKTADSPPSPVTDSSPAPTRPATDADSSAERREALYAGDDTGGADPADDDRDDRGARGGARSKIRARHRIMILGADVVASLEGTSLDSAKEQDELAFFLNRGAPRGELTDEVRMLVDAAKAGEKVSAVAYTAGITGPQPPRSKTPDIDLLRFLVNTLPCDEICTALPAKVKTAIVERAVKAPLPEYLDAIGAEAILAALPLSWLGAVRAWLATHDARSAPAAPAANSDDLEIPLCLRREPPRRLN